MTQPRRILWLAVFVAAAVSIVLGSTMGVQAAFAGTTSSDSPSVTFTSPNPQLHGLFGLSVAVSGGIKVVGTPGESATVMGATIAGAGQAYIFDAPTGTLIATLTSPNAQAGGGFGNSVAVISDPVLGTSVVVGASGESVGAFAQAGQAYVFSSTGTPIATLTGTDATGTSTAQVGGLFGFSVAVTILSSSAVGPVPMVVVGAPGESAGGVSGAGHFYAFLCNPTCGAFGGAIPSPNAQVNGQFGFSVSASGTTASSARVVVGSPSETAGGFSAAGNAYLCGLQSLGAACQTTLTSPNAQLLGFFGSSVAVSGGNTVVVGAPNENVTVGGVLIARAGNTYLFSAAGTTTVTSPNPQTPGAQGAGGFGASVALSGSSLVVGSPGESAGGFSGAGHAYIFDTTGSSTATLTSPNAAGSGRFGVSVANDVGPAGVTLLVGAPTETASGLDSAGHAYLYNLPVGDFSIGAITPLTISAGGSGSVNVTVNPVNGFSSAVDLSVSAAPVGVMAPPPSPAQVTPSGGNPATSILNVSVSPALTPTNFTLTVTGTSGTLTHSATADVTVIATTSSITNLIGGLVTQGCVDSIANALTSKLAQAQAAISAGNIQMAINILTALKKQLQAQSGKHIATTCTTPDGVTFNPVTVLLMDVQALIDSLRTSMIPDPITGYVVNSSGVGVAGAAVSIFDAGGNVVATATTDITGFYFFATMSVLNQGLSYTVAVTGFTTPPPPSPAFMWSGSGMMIGTFVLN